MLSTSHLFKSRSQPKEKDAELLSHILFVFDTVTSEMQVTNLSTTKLANPRTML